MSKKFITYIMLFMMLLFLLAGFGFKKAAEMHKGLKTSMGVVMNDEYKEAFSGRIGADTEKYKICNIAGTVCYVFGEITSVLCLILVLSYKKNS